MYIYKHIYIYIYIYTCTHIHISIYTYSLYNSSITDIEHTPNNTLYLVCHKPMK